MRGTIGILGCLALAAGIAEAGGKERLVELGRRLFFDPAVHRSGRIACAACHDPDHGFSDPRTVSVEHDGPMRRHSQPLTDLVDGTGMHWDGEFDTVRELIDARLAPGRVTSFSAVRNRERHFERARKEGRRPDRSAFEDAVDDLPPPREMGNLGTPRPADPFMPLAERLHFGGRYRDAFEEAFGDDEPKVERILDALEAYVLSLKTEKNALDRFLAGDPAALTASQRRGYALFTGKANCAACHAPKLDDDRAAMTNREYRNNGVAFPALIVAKGRQRGGDGGRGEMTHVANDLGRFKVPSLRDVARRAPYMHDGSLKTLEAVVEYYGRGGRGEGIDPAIRPFELSDAGKKDVVAFLHALTGERRAGIGPAREPHTTRLRIVDEHGRARKRLAVTVRPFGDRLNGAREGALLQLVTDARGRAEFVFPRWTHVVVESPGLEIGRGMPVPDATKDLELRAVSKKKMFVEIFQAPSVPKEITATGEDTGFVAKLRRVRKLGGQRAIYEVLDVPEDFVGRHVVARLSNDSRSRGRAELDLSMGEAQPLFLPSEDPEQSDSYGG